MVDVDGLDGVVKAKVDGMVTVALLDVDSIAPPVGPVESCIRMTDMMDNEGHFIIKF